MGDSARRTAATLLRVTGGLALQLRVPTPATAGDVGEQLGRATPGFEDLELAPAVLRKLRPHMAEGTATQYEVLVSAECVETLAGGAGLSAAALFGQAYGVLDGERLLAIEGVTPAEVSGSACLYRLLLRGTLAEVV